MIFRRPSSRPSDATGRRSSAFVRKDSDTASGPTTTNGPRSSCSARARETLDAPTPNFAAGGFRKQSGSPGTRASSPMRTWESDAQPGRAPLELSPTHGAGQDISRMREERRADPRPARSSGRTAGPLHAILVTHPPRLLQARTKGSLNRDLRPLESAAPDRIQRSRETCAARRDRHPALFSKTRRLRGEHNAWRRGESRDSIDACLKRCGGRVMVCLCEGSRSRAFSSWLWPDAEVKPGP
jgi:hypothetical protein